MHPHYSGKFSKCISLPYISLPSLSAGVGFFLIPRAYLPFPYPAQLDGKAGVPYAG
jgi:hypothetical protein